MLRMRKYLILSTLLFGLAFASYADVNGGFELTLGIASEKLFGTDQSQYIYPGLQFPSTFRLSGFVGYNTANEDSKIAIGFEQHFGVHLVTLGPFDHLPLIFSLPSRFYVRFGTGKVALDLITGIDNQIVVTGKTNYPAYNYSGVNYLAAPKGYSMGLELGLRVVFRHFYLTGIAEIPIFDSYFFPGMIRLGLGTTF